MIDAKIFKDSVTGRWACADCDFSSQHQTNLRNHIEVHHVATQGYFCPVCSKICKTKNALSIHKSRNKHWNCSKTQLLGADMFTSDLNIGSPGLPEELLQYLGKVCPSEFVCLVCQYRGTQKHHVLNHIEAKHIKVVIHTCDVCGRQCPTKNALYAHKSRTHKWKELTPWKCNWASVCP